MKTFKICLGIFFGISLHLTSLGQQVISLYNGKLPPGSESLILPEEVFRDDEGEVFMRTNVSMPTLTVFRPEKGRENGTAIIVCPGGGFLSVGYSVEGLKTAKWLVSKGITAFILKYRSTPMTDTVNKIMEKGRAKGSFDHVDSLIGPFVPLAVEDGLEAVRYVRQHSPEYGVEKNRIGMIGFSAGGALIASVALTYDKESRPDFVAPIYNFCQAMIGDKVPADAPPMFMAMAADDPISNCNTALYEKWRDAKKPIEMHIFFEGGHGHGIEIQNKAFDGWTTLFEDWLMLNGFILTKEAAQTVSPAVMVNFKRNLSDRVISDWASVNHYEADNISKGLPGKGEKRVVFMGNSITDFWMKEDSMFFKNKSYIDRGIAGQQTDQMLVRFSQDVINLSPSVVVILAGTNDIHAEKPLQQIMNNIISMVQLSKVNKIIPVLCSVTPVLSYPISPGVNPVEKVIELNNMIKNFALKNKIIYVDYYSAMVDKNSGMKPDLTSDGIHPNLAGYKVMEPLVESAIQKAMK
jgi:acetyl esterase/lipase/lysophospholipase L1-like esterase